MTGFFRPKTLTGRRLFTEFLFVVLGVLIITVILEWLDVRGCLYQPPPGMPR